MMRDSFNLPATELQNNPELTKKANEIDLELKESSPLEVMRHFIYLTENKNKNNDTLSDYFFLISELKELSKQLRDLALDISIWLSDEDEEKTIKLYKNSPKEAFKKIIGDTPQD